MPARWFSFMAGVLLLGAVQADDDPARFLIEMELWLHGEQAGTPSMIVVAGQPASIQVGGDVRTWRIEAEVEIPAVHEYAPGDALWLHLAVHEQVEGEWEVLADTMLGVPEGRSATLSVVEGEVEEALPDNSLVFLRATTSRLASGEMPGN